jgi:hypothetical protein
MFWRDENPFDGRFLSALLPIGDKDLNHLYVPVDGFKLAESQINSWTTASAEARTKPVVALILGPKGSGRSSVARYVAYRCAAATKGQSNTKSDQGLLENCFIEFPVADEHPVLPSASLISGFFNKAIEQNLPLTDIIIKYMLNRSAEPSPDSLSNLYSLMRIQTKGPIRVPVFCLEQVRNFAQISVAAQVLRSDAVIICTTTLQAVASDFVVGSKDGSFQPLQLNLTGLASDDVVKLYEQRWQAFAKDPQSILPIDKSIIGETFVHNWPIRGTIIVLNYLLSVLADAGVVDGAAGAGRRLNKEEVQAGIIRVLNERFADIRGN